MDVLDCFGDFGASVCPESCGTPNDHPFARMFPSRSIGRPQENGGLMGFSG